MSAKEMFEELGYEQDLNNKYYIGYIKILNNYGKQRTFTFMKEMKFFTFVDQNNSVAIELNELKAINKQIEELGWLKDK